MRMSKAHGEAEKRPATHAASSIPNRRIPLVMACPSKPVTEMTKAERRAFAKAFVDAMFGRYERAVADAEKALHEEDASVDAGAPSGPPALPPGADTLGD